MQKKKRVGGIKLSEGRHREKEGMKRRFTGQTLTSHSQLDGFVINFKSLRVWTSLGTHFKRILRFCLLASDLAWRTGRLCLHIWLAVPWLKLRLCVS